MITSFVQSLKDKPTQDLFNPWFEQDKEHDLHLDAPNIRRDQLETYLQERKNSAKYLFIAEALGYQGGHFTGIAMTSERILLGHQEKKYGVKPEQVFTLKNPKRTSRPDFIEKGMSEPTATIMWGALADLNINPYEVVLWNAVPWHPYNSKKGILSNRTPTQPELEAGLQYLNTFISLFEDVRLIAVGRKCEQSLSLLGKTFTGVRHPANGGAPKFRRQLQELVGNGQK